MAIEHYLDHTCASLCMSVAVCKLAAIASYSKVTVTRWQRQMLLKTEAIGNERYSVGNDIWNPMRHSRIQVELEVHETMQTPVLASSAFSCCKPSSQVTGRPRVHASGAFKTCQAGPARPGEFCPGPENRRLRRKMNEHSNYNLQSS